MRAIFAAAAFLALWASIAQAGDPDLYLDPYALADQVSVHLVQTGATRGDPHKISLVKFTKTIAFANGFSRRYTAQKQDLVNWMEQQSDGSVAPDALLAKAVDLSQGDVLEGLTMCWDVLREDWNRMPRRNSLEHALKLKDITGEREYFDGNYVQEEKPGFWANLWRKAQGKPLRSETITGDNFSATYHFFGTALNAYIVGLKTNPTLGKLQTQLLITIQEQLVSNRFYENEKRVALDRSGARFGARLLSNLNSPHRFLNRIQRDGLAQEYLYVRPGVYGSRYGKARDDHAETMMKRIIALRALPRNSPEVLAAVKKFVDTPIPEAIEEVHGPFQKKFHTKIADPPESVVRSHAIRLLGQRDDEASLTYLHSLLSHPAWSVRESAIEALSRRKPADLLDIVRKALTDRSARVREAAVRALIVLKTSPELERILDEQMMEAGSSPTSTAASEVAIFLNELHERNPTEYPALSDATLALARKVEWGASQNLSEVASSKSRIIAGIFARALVRKAVPITLGLGACAAAFSFLW